MESEGDYEFCSDGAQNILSLEIIDDAGTSIFSDAPKFSLNCKLIHLTSQKYIVKLKYIDKIDSMYNNAVVPYVRLFEKREIESDVTDQDWIDGKLYESIFGSKKYKNFLNFRYCYKTPINDDSIVSLWMNSSKISLGYRVNLDDGSTFKCTYLGTDSTMTPSSVGDIGDIDIIVSSLMDIKNKESMVYSRPASSSREIDLDTAIKIKFIGTIDRLALNDAFSISPKVNGSLSVNGQILTFVPDNKLEYMSTYRVQLKGLSNDGLAIRDIDFSFTTHDKYSYDDSKSNLDDLELCSVGISSYCYDIVFSTVTNIQTNILNNSKTGSRTLEIKTNLNKATAQNILVDYSLLNDDNISLLSGIFLVEAGALQSINEISFDVSMFSSNEQNATLKINKISNVYNSSDYSFKYIVKNGEFFNTQSEMLEPEIVKVNNMSFNNNILTIDLNSTAVEDVDLNIYFEGSNKVITSCLECSTGASCNTTCSSLYLREPSYEITTIKKGTSSVDINFTFSINKDAYIYSEDFVATVYASRNASVGDGVSENFSLSVSAKEIINFSVPSDAALGTLVGKVNIPESLGDFSNVSFTTNKVTDYTINSNGQIFTAKDFNLLANKNLSVKVKTQSRGYMTIANINITK